MEIEIDERQLKIEEIKKDTLEHINKYGIPPYVFRLTKREMLLIQNSIIRVKHNNKSIGISIALLDI